MSVAFVSAGNAGLATSQFALRKTSAGCLPGFATDDHLDAFNCFLASCAHLTGKHEALRQAKPPSPALGLVCTAAMQAKLSTAAEARNFFEANFQPYEIIENRGNEPHGGFFTGYYEPIVEGSLVQTNEFPVPLYGVPDDLIPFPHGKAPPGLDPVLRGARHASDGTLVPYHERGAIEAGAIESKAQKIIFIRDRAESFLIHVQGSARVQLPNGRIFRLVYAGRNGQPYTSIGRLLIQSGEIPQDEMSLARLKHWIRSHGQNPGEAGFDLMAQNKSYIFFSLQADLAPAQGPKGGEGLALTPFRSIAIDRSIWSYGLPFFIGADVPWHEGGKTNSASFLQKVSAFNRLMIAQDTGSAILGAARADIFFGSGDDAGQQAGNIRHHGRFFVLLPQDDARGLERNFA